jgi:hypothetical protein
MVTCCHQWQTLEPSGKRKLKRGVTLSVKTPKGTEEKSTLKGTAGMTRFRDSVRQK